MFSTRIPIDTVMGLTEDDFRCTIMPCTDDARMELVVKRCTTEIDQSNLGISQDMLGFRVGPLSDFKRVSTKLV